MGTECRFKFNYSTERLGEAQRVLLSSFREIFSKRSKDIDKVTPDEIINAVVKSLQSGNNSIAFMKFREKGEGEDTRAYNKQVREYEASIQELSQSLCAILNPLSSVRVYVGLEKQTIEIPYALKTGVLKALQSPNFFSMAGISSEDTSTESDGEDNELVIHETELENEETRNKIRIDDALNLFFGTQYGARSYFNESTRLAIYQSTVFNHRSKLRNTRSTLNQSIYDLMNDEFNNIVKYLEKVDPDTNYSYNLFDENYNVKYDYAMKVLNTFYNHFIGLGKTTGDKIFDGWDSIMKRKPSENIDFFNAVSGYVRIQYLDDLISEYVPEFVQYRKSNENQLVPITFEKYSFAKGTSHKKVDWSDSDENVLGKTSKFAKTMLLVVPIKHFSTKEFTNKYLSLQNFNGAITKLFDAITKLPIENNAKLKNAATRFHENPVYYARELFNILFGNGDESRIFVQRLLNKEFTQDDLNILYSVYDYFFNGENSVYEQEIRERKHSFSINGYSLIECLAGVMNRTMSSNYLQSTFSIKKGYETKVKKKYNSRRSSYTVVNNINTIVARRGHVERVGLINKYSGSRNKYTEYTVKLPNSGVRIKFIAKNKFFNLSETSILISKDNGVTWQDFNKVNLFDPLSKNCIKFGSQEQIEKILSGNQLTHDEKIVRDVLEFIDDNLKLNLLSEQGLSILNIHINGSSNKMSYISGILETALKAMSINQIYKEFEDEVEKGNYSKNGLLNYLKDTYFANGGFDSNSKYLYTRYGKKNITTLSTAIEWVDELQFAEAILDGSTQKSVIKDLNDKNIANYKKSFLGGNIKYYLDKYSRANHAERNATASLLISQNPDLLKTILMNQDAMAKNGTKKSVKEMRSGELLYSAIICNFYGAYLSGETIDDRGRKVKTSEGLSGQFVIQPTTIADKTAFINFGVDGDKMFIIPSTGVRKSIAHLTKEETIELYRQSIGGAYKQLFNNVINDLRTVLGLNSDATPDLVINELKKIKEKDLIEKAAALGIEIQKDTHYRADKKGNLRFNELLYYYANDLYDSQENLRARLKHEEFNFVRDLIESRVNFYTAYYDDETENKDNPILQIINSDLFTKELKAAIKLNWIKNGKLIIAKIDGKEVTRLSDLREGHTLQMNPILEKFFYTDSLLANNIRFALTGSEVAHPDKSSLNYSEELKLVYPDEKISASIYKVSTALNNLGSRALKIIWAHPGIGKTYLAQQGNDKYIDFDSDYKLSLCDKYGIEKNIQSLMEWRHASKENRRIYENDLIALYAQAKNDVTASGKVLLVSDLSLLQNNSNDFSLILTLSDDLFKLRSEQRGENYNEGWKLDINRVLESLSDENKTKIYDIDDMYMTDLVNLSENNLPGLLKSSNTKLVQYARSILMKTEAVAQGTQLKRNVIITATLDYTDPYSLEGATMHTKVAIINDTKYRVFNFRGDNKSGDAHDGSALYTAFEAILENGGLQDQEVGDDKKNIWHHFDPKLMSATLLKFAVYAMTNDRMRVSRNSDISLYDLFKQMTDLAWQNEDGTWNTRDGSAIDLVYDKGFKANSRDTSGINFNDILKVIPGGRLFYKEAGSHYEIKGFGKDEYGYYTLESKSSSEGISLTKEFKVYHKFNDKGNYFKFSEEEVKSADSNLKNINSLFQLHAVMGGINSESLIDDQLQLSEASNYAVVGFMNNVCHRNLNGDSSDMTQRTYYQPLKEMLIAYAANQTAVKNGSSNVNDASAWKGLTKLKYMVLDIDGLGVQQDSDHEIEDSEMTEFSQVISALEAGGRLHAEAREVYESLGRLALLASNSELSSVEKFVLEVAGGTVDRDKLLRLKSDIYDTVGRAVVYSYKQNEDKLDLAAPVINLLKKHFDLNDNHIQDDLHVPFSDSNLYGSVISTFMSNINKKSIKRKYPGSGCVMVPAYNIIQNFKLIKVNEDGSQEQGIYSYENLLLRAYEWAKSVERPTFDRKNGQSIANFELQLVKDYLDAEQSDTTKYPIFENATEFIPTDIVDAGLVGEDGTFTKIFDVNFDDIDTYFTFKGIIKYKNLDLFKRFIDEHKIPELLPLINDAEHVEENNAKLQEILNNLKFRSNITKPRNLAPARVSWRMNGVKMSIYDVPKIMQSFGYLDKEGFGFVKTSTNLTHEDRLAIQKIFDELDKGKYEGEDIEDLQNEAAELIMSNLYANEFDTKGKSLAEILDKGVAAFRVSRNKVLNVATRKYDLAFISNKNKSVYIQFDKIRKGTESYAPKQIDWKYKKVFRDPQNENIEDVYATTKEGEKLFKIGRYMLNTEYQALPDGKIVKKGETTPQNNPKLKIGYDGRVYEYNEFVTQYSVSELQNGKIVSYTLYQINKETISKCVSVSDDKLRAVATNSQIGSILSNIYSSGNYSGMRVCNSMRTQSAISVYTGLKAMRNSCEDSVGKLIDNTLPFLANAHENKEEFYQFDLKEYNNMLMNYYNEFAQERFTSFQNSLYFTASRIPAQTLQSFMQMKLVGFANTSTNKCYVSHWQTYLQGSDYDIDKSYIMGFSFDDNGRYIGWSNLFDYSSLKTLKASEKLPIPNKNLVVKRGKGNAGYDISSYLDLLSETTDKAAQIEIYAKMLKAIDSYFGEPDVEMDINLVYDQRFDDIPATNGKDKSFGLEVLGNISKHYKTSLSGEKLQSALKNKVSSSIQRIIQNVRNMDQAYTSIDGEMDRIRNAAKKSPKGEKIKSMSLMNPATKFLMQEQNMTGKGVIGITAVGEKTFFNLSDYWNEGIRHKDDKEWIKNLQFSKTFNRIQGRSSGNISSVTKTTLANVNFESVEDMRRQFAIGNSIDVEVRRQFGITNLDIRERNNNWQKYNQELIRRLEELLDTDQYVDLNISSLLSAATDNAKELILAKINAGKDLAKCYLHLIMMGFSLEDISSFMISPSVQLVADLLSTSMFDEYVPKVNGKGAIKTIRGDFPVYKFFIGEFVDEDQSRRKVDIASSSLNKFKIALDDFDVFEYLYLNKNKEISELFKSVLTEKTYSKHDEEVLREKHIPYKILTTKNKNGNEVPSKILQLIPDRISLSQVTKLFYKLLLLARYDSTLNLLLTKSLEKSNLLKGRSNFTELSLIDFCSSGGYQLKNNMQALSDYINYIINTIDEKVFSKNAAQTYDDFLKDLDEFELVYKLSEETSKFGNYFLGENQGLPTSEAELLQLLFNIQTSFNERLEEFVEVDSNSKSGPFSNKDKINKFRDKVKENNQFITDQDINEAINAAEKAGLIKNGEIKFDGMKWLTDEKYKNATIKMYNLIKGTWNIFDVINRLPHYQAIFKLFSAANVINNNLIRKSNLLLMIANDIYGSGNNFISAEDIKGLQQYIDGLLILDYIEKSNFGMPLKAGSEMFDESFARRTTSDSIVKVGRDEQSRGTFKINFELMIENMKNGFYYDYDQASGEMVQKSIPIDNEFIKMLIPAYDMNDRIFYKLNLDMQQVNKSAYNASKYSKCLNGFMELKNYTINGISLTDWFMLYNFVVNKNMWGSERLTSLFQPFIEQSDDSSAIMDYFKKTGDGDWDLLAHLLTMDDLVELGYNRDDALLSIADKIHLNQESTAMAKVIKEVDPKTGMEVVKVRTRSGNYKKVNLLLDNINRVEQTEEDSILRQSDYHDYCFIQIPNYNMYNSNERNLLMGDISKKAKALYFYMYNGLFEVYKINC